VRLRQICLIARDIDWAVNSLTAALDTRVAFRDPDIVQLDLFNALLQCGDCMLEIVSPTEAGYEKKSTAAKLLEKKGGDCGYMAILQVRSTQSGRHSRIDNTPTAARLMMPPPPTRHPPPTSHPLPPPTPHASPHNRMAGVVPGVAQVDDLGEVSRRLSTEQKARPVTAHGMKTRLPPGEGGRVQHFKYRLGASVQQCSGFGSDRHPSAHPHPEGSGPGSSDPGEGGAPASALAGVQWHPKVRSAVLPFCRSAVLPFCRSAVLPFCRSAVLPFCRSESTVSTFGGSPMCTTTGTG
jgi:hypothetical protein